MSQYVIDTIGLVRYLEGTLPKKADKIFADAEQRKTVLLLPSIVIGEFIYTVLKGKTKTAYPKVLLAETIESIHVSGYFKNVDMDLECWYKLLELTIPELHDRMLCAIALRYNAPIITNDEHITKSKAVEVIWE